MSSYALVPTGIPNPQSDLFLGFNAGFKFNCNICKGTGEQLVCICNKCKRSMHPSCAGVETGTVYSTDGTKQVVLPGPEKLPKSCRECLRETGRIVMLHQLIPQQTYFVQAPSSSNSITRFYESGTEPLHKIEEGHDDFMVHKHKPGHMVRQMDNGAIYKCSGCKMESFGLHYACENASCFFLLHEECESPRKFTRNRFYTGLTFAFSSLENTSYSKHNKKAHTNVFCNACGMDVKGYYYHSMDGKNNLHPCCINLPQETICGQSGVKMVLQEKTTSKCGYCHARRVKVGGKSTDHVWSYVAESENDHLHVGCMIKMLSDLREDSMGRLISCKMISKNSSVGKMNLEIVLRRAKTMCERKFRIFTKYGKIVLGAIIAALLGDMTTLFVNSAAALTYK